MRLISRSLLVCVLGVVLGGFSQTVGAVAAEPNGEEASGGSLLGAPLVVGSADRLFLGGAESQAAREATHSNPEAVVARAASRTSFESLAPGQMASEAKVAFPSLIEQPAGGPPRLPAGQRIVRYATDNAAQVSLPGGDIGVVESLEPIAAGTSHGHHAPLDLRLEEADGHFQPALSDVGVDVPKDLSDGVSLSGVGVSLTPVDGHGSPLAASEGAVDGSAVVWGDAEAGAAGVHDLATLAKASPEGFDLTSMLLSRRSPGTLYFRVGMPSGAHLESAGDGSVRVVKGGATLAIVSPVSARDAEGTEVPVSMDVHGDMLVVTVDLSGDYLYPIAVDPEVIGVDSQIVTTSGGKRTNWLFETNAASKYEGAKGALETKGIAEYQPGEFAYWRYQTNGVSKIYGVTTVTSAKNKNAKIESFLEFEKSGGAEETKTILSTEGKEPEYENKPTSLCAANGAKKEETVCLPSYGTAKNVVRFQQSPVAKPGSNYKFSDTMSQGIVSISEPEGTHSTTSYKTTFPGLEFEAEIEGKKEKVKRANVLYGSGAWLSKFSGAFETVAKDTGIGVALTKLEYESSAGKWTQLSEHNYLGVENACQGVQCYETHSEDWTLPSGLPDGEQKLRYKAEEAMSGTQSLTTEGLATVKVDTTAPHAIELEGLPSDNELSERAYELTAEATDGEGTTVPSSGMKSITLYVDGKSIEDKEEASSIKEAGKKEGGCSTSKGACTASAKWMISGAELGAGHHTIVTVATDNAGNESRIEEAISISHSTPVAFGPGSVDLQSGDYSLGATDVDLGSGLTVSRNYSSRAVEAGIEGPLGAQWSLSLGASESLLELADGSVLLASQNGEQSIFKNLGAGKYQAPTGDSNLTLSFEENKTTKENAYYLKNSAAGTSDKFTLPSGSRLWMPTKQEGTVATDTVTYGYKAVVHQDEFPQPSEAEPDAITTGPDGNIWYTDSHRDTIGKMSPSGTVLAEYPTQGAPGFNVPGPNIVSVAGDLYFLEGVTAASGDEERLVEISPSGKQNEYALPTHHGAYMAAGPDGQVWITEPFAKKIVVFHPHPAAGYREYEVPNGEPFSITAGPDGNVWFVTPETGKIDKITPTGGTITEYPAPSTAIESGPQSITAGPDGNVWFSESTGKIDKITPYGAVTAYPLPPHISSKAALTAGPDKNIWFSGGKITPSGVITEYELDRATGITSGPDGNIWFTDNEHKKIDRTPVSAEITEPTEILAPVPPGVSCSPEMKPGCRALKFGYGSGNQLVGVSLEAYNPSSKKMEAKTVAGYSYNAQHQLIAESDPHGLKTRYGYDAEGHITALSPPGQETWAFAYGTIQGDLGNGRLMKISRSPASEALWGGGAAPENTALPKITGSILVGVRMAVSDGAWSGSPIAYSYQWEDCELPNGAYSSEACTVIAGANSANYTPTTADVGYRLMALVTATNGGGSTVASSGEVGEVKSRLSALGWGETRGITTGSDGKLWTTTPSSVDKMTIKGEEGFSYGMSGQPYGIAAGPDGNLWFAQLSGSKISKITTSGVTTSYALPPVSAPLWITAGPDGNMWFTDLLSNKVGKITRAGVVTEYSLLPGGGGEPAGIAAGPDGNMWVAEEGGHIAKVTTSGTVTHYSASGKPYGITAGPDGNMWFTESEANKIVKITTSGTETEYSLPAGSSPHGITAGPDGNLWFVDYGTSKVGDITTSGTITEYGLSAGNKPLSIMKGPEGNMLFTGSGVGRFTFGTEAEARTPSMGWVMEYNTPLTAGPGLQGMTSGEVAKWGQTDSPVEATAILPPDADQGWPATSYKRATTYYLDERGRAVNVSSPSSATNGSIATTEYNEFNDPVRSLSADSRQTALEAGSKSVEVSKLLDTQSTYNGEGAKEGEVEEPGTRLIETLGPQHQIKYVAGKEQKESLAREHTKFFYDEGAPGGEKYDLVTKTSSLAQLVNEEEVEVRKTTTSYSGQSNLGWKLRAPTSVTSDPEGKKITHTTLYNPTTAQITETRGPAGSGGESAHDSRIIYYGSEANTEGFSACGSHPEWAGLVCETLPAKQPTGGVAPKLPVTTATYNMLNEPLVMTETFGTTVRTKTETYDEAGRLANSETTSSADTALPKVTNEYNSTSGALEKQSTTVEGKTKTVTSKYNTLGQRTEYVDSDGNTAKYKYAGLENDGLLEEMSDGSAAGAGKQAYSYNATTKLMEKLTDSSAGAFTASYDTEGKLTSEVYPNGMCANSAYNSVGEATHVEYIKTTNCAEHEPGVWFSETRSPSVRGETLSRASTLASESYFYDTLGRLTEAQETPAGAGCSTRLYGYDEESNRTSQTTRAPGGEGKCATSGGTVQEHTYDEGNRMTDTGIVYDSFGNVTKLPAADAEGHELVSTFYVDGAVATQSQNGVSNSYYLDPEGRVRETISGASTTIEHYDSPGEAVAWSSEGEGKSKRNIPGIDGALAATQTNSETPVMQLHDLQGDVVATIGDKTGETKLLSTYNSTEFGVPNAGKAPPTFAWMGAGDIASSLPSGVITYGATSYVPQTGRALQSEQVEPPGLPGGSGAGTPYTMQVEPWIMQGAAREAAEAPGLEAAREQAAREAAEAAAAAAEEAEAGSGGGGDPTVWLRLGPGQAEAVAAALRKGLPEMQALAKSGKIKGFTMLWVELIKTVSGEPGYGLNWGMANGLDKCAKGIDSASGTPGRCKFHIDYLEADPGSAPLVLDFGVETCWGQRHNDAGTVYWTYPYCAVA